MPQQNAFYDIIWFCCQLAALCSNNVKCCYDWIVLLVVGLCLCHLGASPHNAFSMICRNITYVIDLETPLDLAVTKMGFSNYQDRPREWSGTPYLGHGQLSYFELMKQDGFSATMVGVFLLATCSLVALQLWMILFALFILPTR